MCCYLFLDPLIKKEKIKKNKKNIFRRKQKITIVRRGYQRLKQLRTELNSSE